MLEREELLQKIEETVALGGDQILMQVVCTMNINWIGTSSYAVILKSVFHMNIHGFSPPELYHFTKMNGITIEEVLTRLKAAGLVHSYGGAEILVDRVRME